MAGLAPATQEELRALVAQTPPSTLSEMSLVSLPDGVSVATRTPAEAAAAETAALGGLIGRRFGSGGWQLLGPRRSAKLLLMAGDAKATESPAAALLSAAVGPPCNNGVSMAMSAGGRELSSVFRGVSLQCGRWRARLCVRKRDLTLGDFCTGADAAVAYDTAYIAAFPGETRHLNFVYSGLNDTAVAAAAASRQALREAAKAAAPAARSSSKRTAGTAHAGKSASAAASGTASLPRVHPTRIAASSAAAMTAATPTATVLARTAAASALPSAQMSSAQAISHAASSPVLPPSQPPPSPRRPGTATTAAALAAAYAAAEDAAAAGAVPFAPSAASVAAASLSVPLSASVALRLLAAPITPDHSREASTGPSAEGAGAGGMAAADVELMSGHASVRDMLLGTKPSTMAAWARRAQAHAAAQLAAEAEAAAAAAAAASTGGHASSLISGRKRHLTMLAGLTTYTP